MRPSSIYSVQLVDPSGSLLADLSGRASRRVYTQTRNAADDIEWYLNIDDIENYCRQSKIDPRLILICDNTEVRIKRGNTVVAAGQLNYKNGNLAGTDNNLLQIRAVGFLNLFAYRYTGLGQVYSGVDGSQIAWDLINTSQTGGNDFSGVLNTATGKYSGGLVPLSAWDFGITQGTLATVGNHNRSYNYMAVTDALTDLCNAPTGSFDMQITYDKKFNTYAQMGTQRNDIVFEYPGNIIDVKVVEDGTQVFNQIIAQGTGNGTIQQNISVADTPFYSSEGSYKVRQQFVSPSSLDTSDSSLQDYANWNMNLSKSPLLLPTITTEGGLSPFVTDYSIGDWVKIRIRNHPLYADINGMYRVEQKKVTVDEDDHETVEITTSLN